MYKNFFKRLFDIIGALSAIPFVLLISLFVGLAIYIEDRGDIFYLASRRGRYGEIFKMFKFRSMKMNAPDIRNSDNSTYNSPDDPRITKVGRFIRKTSIDELPQLINVIKGDMALIGPRPLLPQYLPLYSREQARRHEVRPGITGWAQVNGRNAISWTKKFELDVWYVEHCSLLLDAKTAFLTIKKVFAREDINSNASTTMEPFTGNN